MFTGVLVGVWPCRECAWCQSQYSLANQSILDSCGTSLGRSWKVDLDRWTPNIRAFCTNFAPLPGPLGAKMAQWAAEGPRSISSASMSTKIGRESKSESRVTYLHNNDFLFWDLFPSEYTVLVQKSSPWVKVCPNQMTSHKLDTRVAGALPVQIYTATIPRWCKNKTLISSALISKGHAPGLPVTWRGHWDAPSCCQCCMVLFLVWFCGGSKGWHQWAAPRVVRQNYGWHLAIAQCEHQDKCGHTKPGVAIRGCATFVGTARTACRLRLSWPAAARCDRCQGRAKVEISVWWDSRRFNS